MNKFDDGEGQTIEKSSEEDASFLMVSIREERRLIIGSPPFGTERINPSLSIRLPTLSSF